VKHLEVELPETLIKREVDFSITQTAMRLSEQGLDIKKAFTSDVISALRQQARPEAITRLQRTMALGEVAKQESIQVEPEELEAKVNAILADYSGQELDVDRLRQVLEEDLLKDKILSWLEEHGTVELVPEGTLKSESEDDEALAETSDAVEVTTVDADTEAEVVADEADAAIDPQPVTEVTVEATEVDDDAEAIETAPSADPAADAAKTTDTAAKTAPSSTGKRSKKGK
jgi:trigger factor